MKYFVSFLLSVLLVGCAGSQDSGNGKENGDDQMKTITIKIVDNETPDQRCLLSINTNGKQNGEVAILPSSSLKVTNENKEAKVSFYLNTKYLIKVSKTKAKNAKEFLKNKKSGRIEGEVFIKDIEFTPTSKDKELEIKL